MTWFTGYCTVLHITSLKNNVEQGNKLQVIFSLNTNTMTRIICFVLGVIIKYWQAE